MLALLAPGCAQIQAPSGGPEDRTTPRVVGTYPDSGAAEVVLADSLVLIFSEPMNRRTVEDAFFLSPAVEYRERQWKGQTWTLRLREPLKPGRTYAGLLGIGAKDRHGLGPAKPWSFAFATGESLDTGEVTGKVIGSRYSPRAAMLYVWPWADGPPDTTKRGYPREPLRLGQANDQGVYTLKYLPRNRELRLCALFSQGGDQEYDPATDHWGCCDTPLVIGDTSRVASMLDLYLAYADEPGTVAGLVVDSLCLRSTACKELRRTRARRDSLREWLDENGTGIPRGTSIDSALVPRPRMTGEDSLRIGLQLLSVDSLLARAAAESVFCARPIVVQLTDSALVRECQGQGEFRWNDVPPGVYRLHAFRDADGNGRADAEEPIVRSAFALEVRPLHVIEKLRLELPHPAVGKSP